MGFRIRQLGGFFLILAMGSMGAVHSAQAEWIIIKSKVVTINAASDYLKVDYLNPESGEMEEIKVNVERSTHFEIYTSLLDIKEGDDVSIEADFNAFTHEWKALSIAPYNENSALKILRENAQNPPANQATNVPAVPLELK